MRPTQILRHLSADELLPLQRDLEEARAMWGDHYLISTPQGAPLRHGKSIYLLALNLGDRSILVDHRDQFSSTITSVASWTGQRVDRLARSYWHRLKPGEYIDPHTDRDFAGQNYFASIVRYQIFPELPSEFVVLMDSKLWHHSPETSLSMSLVDFNFRDWHYYANHSSKEVSFLVMDFFL